jgi:hypothetical protein
MLSPSIPANCLLFSLAHAIINRLFFQGCFLRFFFRNSPLPADGKDMFNRRPLEASLREEEDDRIKEEKKKEGLKPPKAPKRRRGRRKKEEVKVRKEKKEKNKNFFFLFLPFPFICVLSASDLRFFFSG